MTLTERHLPHGVAVAQTGVNMVNFDKAFRSVRQEYWETGHVSFLNGANAVLSGLGVVGGIGQSVSSIQSFGRMRSSLSSKSSLSSGASQQYANIADGVCFVEGTEVKTEEGRKAIEEIEAGDRVYAKDTETGEEGYKEVVRVFRKETKELIHLWIGESRIDTTPNHPFWIEGYGFREAGELQEGDKVLTADGEVLTVARVEFEILEEPVKVYNFEVADWHTYYVSEEEVLVHNTCTAGQGVVTTDATVKNNTIIKPDFIVTPNGTVMDTSKNYNLVGIGEKGDWFQIHNFGKAESGVGFPHTHKPQMNTDGIHVSFNRIVSDTSAEDIDNADKLLRNGIMIIRKGKR